MDTNPVVRHIKALTGYSFESAGPWVGTDQQIIGVIVYVKLDQSQSLEEDWPVLGKAQDGTRVNLTLHYRIVDLKEFALLIDLGHNQLADLRPLQYSAISGYPGDPTPIT